MLVKTLVQKESILSNKKLIGSYLHDSVESCNAKESNANKA